LDSTYRTSDAVSGKFETVFTTDELDRAGRFRFSYLRESFVIARGILRYLLRRYIDLQSTDIRLIYGSKGKPALDAPTESAVLSSVSKSSEGQTLILISHRISSLAWVNRFVLLDRGRIVETGNHEVLYARSVLYRSLFDVSAHDASLPCN
jgi:hypothetical protein